MNRKKILAVLLIMCMLTIILVEPVIASINEEVDSTAHESGGNPGKGKGGSSGSGGSGESHDDTNAETDDGEEGSKGNGGDNKGGVNKGGGDKGSGGSGSDKGKGGSGGGSGKPVNPGLITVIVEVEGLPEELHPVEVTLFREEIPFYSETEENEDGSFTATFLSEASGDCTITGEAISGYVTPTLEVSLTGDVKTFKTTLSYTVGSFLVQSVELNKSELTLVTGYSEKLIASLIPANANNQNVKWGTSDSSIAEVSDIGLVEAVSAGNCIITVTTDDGAKTDLCNVTVLSIESFGNTEKTSLKNEVVILPEKVAAYMSDDSTMYFDVIWKDSAGNEVSIFQVPINNPEEKYVFDGYVKGTNLLAGFTINVDQSAPPAVPVVGINLDVNTLSLLVGDVYSIVATITPDTATNKTLKWESNNTSVASVDGDGKVTAVSTGSAIISVTALDGGFIAYCMVSVSPVPEISYIYPSGENGVFVEHFDTREEVFINVENLVKARVIQDTTYYVKVEQKGSDPILGKGEVTLGPDSKEFNLFAETSFALTENFSNEYFVSMSADPKYPLNDELTVKTNFKVGTAVPSIPEADVIVNLTMIGGNNKPEGVIFLLARELDESAAETTWQDYCTLPVIPHNPYAPGVELTFADEVKMKGKTNENGLVIWETPKETLKLGGYFLLEVTPNGYVDNLNTVDPSSDDGTLLKEVHLIRGGSIQKYVTNVFVGGTPLALSDSTVITNVSGAKLTSSTVPITTTSTSVLEAVALNTAATTVEQSVSSLSPSKHWARQYVLELDRNNKLPKGIMGKVNDLDDAVSVEEITESLITAGIDTASASISEMLNSVTNMTRQQLAALMMLAFDFGKSEGAALDFKDSGEVDSAIMSYITKANELGIIKGFPDKTFKPGKLVTKAEFYTILDRCLKLKG